MITTVSSTSYNSYLTCPYKWQLQYEYKLLAPEVVAFEIGKAFHNGVEWFHNGMSLLDIIGKLKDIMLKEKTLENINNFSLVRQLLELYVKYSLPLKTQATEYQFRIQLKKCPLFLTGKIDRVIIGGINEYKTSSFDYTQKDLDNIQTKIYSFAYHNKFGQMPESTYWIGNKKKLKKKDYKPQIITFQHDIAVLDEVEDKCVEYYNNIKQKKFDANRGKHCLWCQYRDSCKYKYAK